MACVHTLVQVNLFTNKDTMLQMASCSYDVHVQEIIGAMIVGGSSVMLRPLGNMDLQYVMKVLHGKQISYMQNVPAYLSNMLEYLQKHNQTSSNTLRTLDVGGK